MSRTIIVNLLFGWLTLLMSFVLHDADGFTMIERWISVQIAGWAAALTLLRWRTEVFVPTFLVFCHNLCCFIVAALFSHGGSTQADFTAIMALVEVGVVVFLVLVLRFDCTLLNVEEFQGHQRPDPPMQFRLGGIFGLMTLLAISLTIVMMQLGRQGDWRLGMLLVAQGFVWLLTADQLLQLRARWWLVAAMTLLMFGAWMVYYKFWVSDLMNDWGRLQLMILLFVLAYSWAGWRIVPRELVEQTLNYENPASQNEKV